MLRQIKIYVVITASPRIVKSMLSNYKPWMEFY